MADVYWWVDTADSVDFLRMFTCNKLTYFGTILYLDVHVYTLSADTHIFMIFVHY